MTGLDEIQICYLCGELLGKNTNRDHVPPLQIYARGVRKEHNLNLITLPVHRDCNDSFKLDEEYFTASMSPLVSDTYAGRKVLEGVRNNLEVGKKASLWEKVRREFEKRPSGLILPPGKVVKRIDGERIHRVLWKIARGLYFYHEEQVLSGETVNKVFSITLLNHDPSPELYGLLAAQPNLGRYPGVFDYRYGQIEEDKEEDDLYLLAMLFWNAVIVLLGFHSPDCRCSGCSGVEGDGGKDSDDE
ncbi:MAG: hypothetical protein VST67_13385 [Nitrospirota bacterium]|nr:hypothetical protein [Nitrospirota bacterium]